MKRLNTNSAPCEKCKPYEGYSPTSYPEFIRHFEVISQDEYMGGSIRCGDAVCRHCGQEVRFDSDEVLIPKMTIHFAPPMKTPCPNCSPYLGDTTTQFDILEDKFTLVEEGNATMVSCGVATCDACNQRYEYVYDETLTPKLTLQPLKK